VDAGVPAYLPPPGAVSAGFSALHLTALGRARLRRWSPGLTPDDLDAARGALDRLEVGHLADRPFDRLSSGQQQLVLIARLFVQDAPVCLLDEPLALLDPAHAQAVEAAIRVLAAEGPGGHRLDPPPALRRPRRPGAGYRSRLDGRRQPRRGPRPRPHARPVRGRGRRLPLLRSGLELSPRLPDADAPLSGRQTMLRSRLTLAAAALALFASPAAAQEAPRWSFAIHGGAGVIERASLTPEQDAAYRAALHRALEAGSAVLAAGGSSLDAVQAAIELMEDDPLFNAGRGAVFTAAGATSWTPRS
jgi:hypothetical protein